MRSSDGYLATEDGVRLYFETLGNGPCVVLPNGLYLRDDFAALAERHTLIFYDPRHRGRSDRLTEPERVSRGIRNDVDDLEAVRRHFGLETLDLVGHSYMGLMVILYAREHPGRVGRAVQIGAMEPLPGKPYPPELTGADAVLGEVFAEIGRLQGERDAGTPEEFCRRVWTVLRRIYVVDAAHADRIRWGRCELPNERNFMKYWGETLLPSIQALRLGPEQWAEVQVPVLTIHGRKDRSAPYGGGRDWARALPNARLLTVADAGHAPWVEAPDTVLGALEAFLDGRWPEAAERVDPP